MALRNALKVEVHPDATAVANRAAAYIAECATQAIEQRNRFVLALSGGATPRQMLGILAAETINWRKVHLAQVDERIAPMGSPERNLTQLRDALLDHVRIPEGQFEPMPVEDADLAAAAERYCRLLVRLAGSPALLDLIQLGLGEDGHTASLVPGDAALEADSADVAVTATYKGSRRMTLTFPIINRARRILWLVTGGEKAEAVARLVQGDPSLVASRINRESALLLVDRAAVVRLRSSTAAS